MAGIELLTAHGAPLLARPYFDAGDPGPIVAALAQVPELLEVAMPFLATVLGASAIPTRTKELVILHTSALSGCRFCIHAHTVAALDTGLSRAEVLALRGEMPIETVFDTADRALLGWVASVAGSVTTVDAGVAAALRPHVADHELVELTLLAGATLMLNRFCTALELPTAPATLERLRAEGLA
jgi:AhpD family alkylhydroperoxidase